MSNRKFHLFHLNLIPVIEQKDITREVYLRSLLEKDFEFGIGNKKNYKKASWTYKGAVGKSILGILQKEVPHQHHLSPAEGGEEVTTALWQGAFVMIDPTHHEEGQRASVEFDKVLGVPRNLLTWLFKSLNNDKNKPYEIIHGQIPNKDDFWNYAKKADNKLERVQFNFVVPNMLGTKEQIAKDLKEAGLETGAQEVSVIYQSSKGVNAISKKIKNAVEYIEKGQGSIKARALGLRSFNSNDKAKTTEMPKFDTEENQATEEFGKFKDKVLGRNAKNTDNSDSNDTD